VIPKSYTHPRIALPKYTLGQSIATRRAFGETLARLGAREDVVVVDGEIGNSTHADLFAAEYPERYIESYIAEQQMISTAVGLAKRGKRAVAATFAAFLTRAHDQLRMAQYSDVSLVVNGSHAGVSIGQDGPSQMGLEDLALFRGLHGSVVVYPADATAAAHLTELAFDHPGISYIRTARPETAVLYTDDTPFRLGGSQTLRSSKHDVATVFAAGVTVYEALAAADALAKEGIHVRVIDLYSIKPIDAATIAQAARETGLLLVAEDHGPVGGVADAVREVLPVGAPRLVSLAVTKLPGSATTKQQLHSQGIDHAGIMKALKGAL
jgi:transketolase